VYGASEGLETLSLDEAGAGGQAGASARNEKYVGFPNGVSGDDLVTRAAIQAMRLGARLNAPCEVGGLRREEGFHVVVLADGSEIPTRAVIIASGARYRRLEVDDLERFEGAGVYYAATEMEARVCRGFDTIVVGGGNSAGQAAVYMASQGSPVSLVVRRRELAATMSRYLIERIEADDRITVLQHTEVRGLAGDEHLERVTLEDNQTGERRTVPCQGLFCFIGAVPATAWLGDCVLLDRSGFVVTDRSLPDPVARSSDFGGREPLPFETSIPGVFAVGDVRSGSLKRVAAAVGEGSSAVRQVIEYLATHA
jgi:thioredoxin reductase (NADPH)